MTKFLLTVFPGLSGVCVDELRQRADLRALPIGRLRNAEILAVRADDVAPLLELRVAEDVFAELGEMALSGRPDDIKTLGGMPAWRSKILPVRAKFRVVAQADDVSWRKYRRVDLQAAAEKALVRARPSWRLGGEEAPVEIWLQQVDRKLFISLRLTTNAHRDRGGRVFEREAALRPTIAAAMVSAAQVADDDVFLDPMCGTGTILLERALAGRHAMLLGGDIEASAVKAALANFGPRHKPVRIEQLNARKLPFGDATVDKFVTNLPWGRQIARPEELPVLYRGVLAEAVRVVRPGGRIVLLTSEWELLKRIIKAQRGLNSVRTVANIEVLGRWADMFVLDRM